MNKPCIVFDLDETLISTANRQLKVILDYFEYCGETVPFFTFNQYTELRKRTWKSNFHVFQYLNNVGLNEIQFKNFYKERIESLSYLVMDTLIVEIDKLKSMKEMLDIDFIILSLRTNSTNARKQLKGLGLLHLFNAFFFKKHSISINPKVSILAELKSQRSSICFVGDSESDYLAAKEANVSFIKLNTGIIDFEYSGKSFLDINSYLNDQILCNSVKIN